MALKTKRLFSSKNPFSKGGFYFIVTGILCYTSNKTVFFTDGYRTEYDRFWKDTGYGILCFVNTFIVGFLIYSLLKNKPIPHKTMVSLFLERNRYNTIYNTRYIRK